MRRSVSLQSKCVCEKAKLRGAGAETTVRVRRCLLSSHPAQRSHGRCAKRSNTCLSSASHPAPPPPSLPTVHGCCHGDGQWGRSEKGHVPPPPSVPDLRTAGNDHGGSARVGRQGRVLICSSITFFTGAERSFYPRATNGGAVSKKKQNKKHYVMTMKSE